MASDDELRAEIERLKADNDRLRGKRLKSDRERWRRAAFGLPPRPVGRPRKNAPPELPPEWTNVAAPPAVPDWAKLSEELPERQVLPPKGLVPRKPKPEAVPAKLPQPVQPQSVTIHLSQRHYINADAFGPGPVTVRRDVADVLLEQERNARLVEDQFQEREPAARIIVAHNRVVKVPGELFNQAMDTFVYGMGQR
jgi:hypothetical protein